MSSEKTCLKQPLSKRPKIGFQDQISLNAGQMYCRMLQGEHSAILSTFIKLPFVIKTFVLSIFDWPFKTGLTVQFSFDPFFSNRIERIWQEVPLCNLRGHRFMNCIIFLSGMIVCFIYLHKYLQLKCGNLQILLALKHSHIVVTLLIIVGILTFVSR